MTAHRQVAALPLRRTKKGALEILLVTSRTTGRWIIPKGWPSKRIKDYNAAAREARQEAGVRGKIKPKAIGRYSYIKTELGEGAPIDVAVYLLSVRKQAKRWPEKRERQRAWFNVLEAARKIAEPELSSLIGALHKLSKPAAKVKRQTVTA
jgi:8-oxo-dGTP pyrophosphatase MutT (NUDIX family)